MLCLFCLCRRASPSLLQHEFETDLCEKTHHHSRPEVRTRVWLTILGNLEELGAGEWPGTSSRRATPFRGRRTNSLWSADIGHWYLSCRRAPDLFPLVHSRSSSRTAFHSQKCPETGVAGPIL